MKHELEQKFYERWPEWFRGRNESVHTNLMCFGFEHDDGWFDLEWRLCEDLEKILVGCDYKLFQIKEKFGTLRWYDGGIILGRADELHDRIRQAEQESAKTCEVCGQSGELASTGGWVKTLCDACLSLPEFKDRYKKVEHVSHQG